MKYVSPGFRNVKACSIGAAAVIFAERAARKHYGKSGYCRTCTQVSAFAGREVCRIQRIYQLHTARATQRNGRPQSSFCSLRSVANQPIKLYLGNP
jgi:hypothetical protein